MLFEEIWLDYVTSFSAFDPVRGEPVVPLAELQQLVSKWQDPEDDEASTLALEWIESLINIIVSNPDLWTAEDHAREAKRERYMRERDEREQQLLRMGVLVERQWPGPRELEQDAIDYEAAQAGTLWGEGSADCYYTNPCAWYDEDAADVPVAVHPGEDEGCFDERMCESIVESMSRTVQPQRHISCEALSSVGSTSSEMVPAAHGRQQQKHKHAQAVGPPPARAHYSSDAQFHSARSQWYGRFTGKSLEQCGSLTEQWRAFDAVKRQWRAYSDGRRSLGASMWDGHLTPAEGRMNDM